MASIASLELPRLIAHRGESASAPENTLAAIELAAHNGAEWVEIDVNISRDGIPYVHHDDSLDRCTNGSGYLIRKTGAELDQLDASGKYASTFPREPLPTLAAVTRLIAEKKLGLNLEIKPTAGWEIPTADAICDFLAQHWPEDRPLLISSFSERALQRTREKMPSAQLGMLVCAIPPDWESQMERLDCQTLHCGADFVDATNATAIRAAGYPLLCFTVNSTDQAKQLFSLGVTSVFSDQPSILATQLADFS